MPLWSRHCLISHWSRCCSDGSDAPQKTSVPFYDPLLADKSLLLNKTHWVFKKQIIMELQTTLLSFLNRWGSQSIDWKRKRGLCFLPVLPRALLRKIYHKRKFSMKTICDLLFQAWADLRLSLTWPEQDARKQNANLYFKSYCDEQLSEVKAGQTDCPCVSTSCVP